MWYESLEGWCGILVWSGSLGGEGGGGGGGGAGGADIEVLVVEPPGWPPPRSPTRPRPRPPPLPLPRPRIGCILSTVDKVGGLMNGSCDVGASSSCAAMRCSSPIRRKIDLARNMMNVVQQA